MFWLSSSGYRGYGKGKYSLAFPAGFAFIGLLFLVIGSLIAIRFPSIVTDWAKAEVCLVEEAHKNYKNWVSDLDKEVTISLHIRNLTNLDSLSLGHEPQFTWIGPFEFTEQSEKKTVKFHTDQRVTFTKDLQYHVGIPLDAYVSVPNLWLIRQYTKLGDSAVWLYRTLPQLLSEIFLDSSTSLPAFDLSGFWMNLSMADCDQCAGNGPPAGEQWSFSFQGWLKRNYPSEFIRNTETQHLWRQFIKSILEEMFSREDNLKSTSNNACLKKLEKHQKTGQRCPSCFFSQNSSDLLLLNQHYLQRYESNNDAWSILNSCYSDLFNISVSDGQFYTTISSTDEYFFHYLRKQLILKRVSQRGLFAVDLGERLANGRPEGMNLGILKALFGSDGDHVYDWNTCAVGWNINADSNFQWQALDSRPVDLNPKSEYSLSPPSNVEPCLRPRLPLRLPVMLDGLWRPVIFKYKQTGVLHEESVYVYELTSGALPYDGVFPTDDLKLNVTHALGFLSFISPMRRAQSRGLDEVVAQIHVEPVTGAVWKVQLSLEFSVVIADDLLKVANLTQLLGKRIAIAHVSRTSVVNADAAKFLKEQLKPMLAIICGGVVVSTLLAMIFVGLALALVVKLHWKPFWERAQVQPEPQDLQLLNTVKLRRLMGT